MRALDLFCGGGGASMGLHKAGFEVLGIDKYPYYHHPLGMKVQDVTTLDPNWIAKFDFVWASPPCQLYVPGATQYGTHRVHADLVGFTRDLLDTAGVPYCIENVMTAPLRFDLLLCGSMFGLKLIRHRIFELGGWKCPQPPHGDHHPDFVTVAGSSGGRTKQNPRRGGIAAWREAMGIDWLPQKYLKEAVPPAYSEYIGRQFLEQRNGI